ncbi:uncharacterized protein EMH_0065360 [Eimeria mitis]|uniref:SAG family member n=1 Tax=Eimeria mitis TaxID=44415 RepID=U6K707_9EIME|nr:uncharacterized protein EMH_0065360 [Eimeria mitis]CDJ31258.1 hypothetical protein EMH_0065360 [Eimeria mitis]
MASFYRTATAVCLVALGVLQSQAQGNNTTYKFTVVDVDEDAYLSANLARNGKLPVHISEVTKDESLVTQLTGEVTKATAEVEPDAEGCTALITAELKERFHYSFEHEPQSEDSIDYRQLLQKALDAGLEVFNTAIGCVVGRCTTVVTSADADVVKDGEGGSVAPKETLTKDAVLFCDLKPAAAKESVPFDEEYFNGLIERTTQLKDMTKDDLKNSVGNGPVATASTILIAGLVAMLTAVSA